MPTYQYLCQLCGHEFDALRKIADRHIPETEPCPSCGEKAVEFKISAPLNSFADPVRLGRIKPNQDFRETMKHIKKGNPDLPNLGLKNSMKDFD